MMRKFLIIMFVIFSGFYLAHIGEGIPIFRNASPIYYWSIIGIVLYIFTITNRRTIIIDKSMMISLLAILYFGATQPILNISSLNYTVNLILGFTYYFIVSDLLKTIDNNDFLIRTSRTFLLFSLVLLTIDAIIRIHSFQNIFIYSHSMLTGTMKFYSGKINSLMFEDSNSTGFYAATMFFFALYLSNKIKGRFKFIKISFAILTFLSFSRAAILASLIVYFTYLLFTKLKKLWLILLSPVLIISVIYGTYYLWNILIKNPSFQTKIYIVDNALKYLSKEHSLIDFLVGVGFNTNVIGIWLHDFLFSYLIWSGFIGLILILCFLISTVKITRWKVSYLILFLLISGFSFTPYAIVFFFVVLAIMNRFERTA